MPSSRITGARARAESNTSPKWKRSALVLSRSSSKWCTLWKRHKKRHLVVGAVPPVDPEDPAAARRRPGPASRPTRPAAGRGRAAFAQAVIGTTTSGESSRLRPNRPKLRASRRQAAAVARPRRSSKGLSTAGHRRSQTKKARSAAAISTALPASSISIDMALDIAAHGRMPSPTRRARRGTKRQKRLELSGLGSAVRLEGDRVHIRPGRWKNP